MTQLAHEYELLRTKRGTYAAWLATVSILVLEKASFAIYVPFKEQLALTLIALGVLHGTLDGWLGGRLFVSFKERALFHAIYVFLAASTALVWWLFPWAALALFVGLSIAHFGQGDLQYMNLGRLSWVAYASRGAFVVLTPFLFHANDLVPVLAAMGLPVNRWVPGELDWLGYGMIAQHLVILVMCRRAKGHAKNGGFEYALWMLLSLLFVVADPLVSFAAYFTLWHSSGHVFSLFPRGLTPLSHLFRHVLPVVVLTAVLAMVGWHWVAQHSVAFRWAVLLMSLSCLTVPHMVLLAVSHAATKNGARIERCGREESNLHGVSPTRSLI